MPAPKSSLPVLPPKDREAKVAEVSRFLLAVFPGHPVRVKVEIARPDRTPKQNAYLWAVPYKMLSEATGFDPEELHEHYCGQHFGWVEHKVPKSRRFPTGIDMRPFRTTTRDENGNPDLCSQEDIQAIWQRAQRDGAGIGIMIPDPDPDYWRHKKAA